MFISIFNRRKCKNRNWVERF